MSNQTDDEMEWPESAIDLWNDLTERLNACDVPDHMEIARSESAEETYNHVDNIKRSGSRWVAKESKDPSLRSRRHTVSVGFNPNEGGASAFEENLILITYTSVRDDDQNNGRIELPSAAVDALGAEKIANVVQESLDNFADDYESALDESVVLYESDDGPVRVVDADVDWKHGYTNDPNISITIDGPTPSYDDYKISDLRTNARGRVVGRTDGGIVKEFTVGDDARSYYESSDNCPAPRETVVHNGMSSETKEVVATFMNNYQRATTDPVVEVSCQSNSGNTTLVLELQTAIEIVASYINGRLGSKNVDHWWDNGPSQMTENHRDDPESWNDCTVVLEVQSDENYSCFIPRREQDVDGCAVQCVAQGGE